MKTPPRRYRHFIPYHSRPENLLIKHDAQWYLFYWATHDGLNWHADVMTVWSGGALIWSDEHFAFAEDVRIRYVGYIPRSQQPNWRQIRDQPAVWIARAQDYLYRRTEEGVPVDGFFGF